MKPTVEELLASQKPRLPELIKGNCLGVFLTSLGIRSVEQMVHSPSTWHLCLLLISVGAFTVSYPFLTRMNQTAFVQYLSNKRGH
jgi:hypothetical protein